MSDHPKKSLVKEKSNLRGPCAKGDAQSSSSEMPLLQGKRGRLERHMGPAGKSGVCKEFGDIYRGSMRPGDRGERSLHSVRLSKVDRPEIKCSIWCEQAEKSSAAPGHAEAPAKESSE